MNPVYPQGSTQSAPLVQPKQPNQLSINQNGQEQKQFSNNNAPFQNTNQNINNYNNNPVQSQQGHQNQQVPHTMTTQ